MKKERPINQENIRTSQVTKKRLNHTGYFSSPTKNRTFIWRNKKKFPTSFRIFTKCETPKIEYMEETKLYTQEEQQMARFCQSSVVTRLGYTYAICFRSKAAVTAAIWPKMVPIARSTLSQHLKELKNSGIDSGRN